ncbi:MAG: permease-like cell division protein FtsX [bacterium]|nr:permease-like cell division protein FtsX [bacterium]
MRFQTTKYFIKEACINFKRAGVMSYASIGIITVTLFVLSLFLLFTTNLKGVADLLVKRTSVLVYLKDKIPQQQIIEFEKTISEMEQVSEVVYISKQDALKKFKENLGENKDILDNLPSNPLPNYLEVKVKRSNFVWDELKKISEEIEKSELVTEVDYGQRVVNILDKITYGLMIIIVGITIVLGLVTLIIISNTIGLGLFAREEEIAIMKLVGATNWFIRCPALIEGLLQGIISGGMAIGLLWLLYKFIVVKLSTADALFQLIPIKFIPLEFICGILLASALSGCLGSFLSLHYFLKPKK